MSRSESGAFLSKTSYAQYDLTQYPNTIDTRDNNPNMRGFENLVDYNMAEHVNALADAVMVIQNILGINPQVDKDGVDQSTVNNRITVQENKNFDTRYGGVGWTIAGGQTILGHHHKGGVGFASQVDLASEVTGLLPKTSVNLTYNDTGGLTGADLSVSSQDSTKVANAIADKLSVTQGGTIQKNLLVSGKLEDRFKREWDSSGLAAGTAIADSTTLINQCRRASGTDPLTFLDQQVLNLMYGKYVMIVRARTSSTSLNGTVLSLTWNSSTSGTTTWTPNTLNVASSDFTAAGQWQQFYLTFDHAINGKVTIAKVATSAAVDVDVDYVVIMPTHTAIYDR